MGVLTNPRMGVPLVFGIVGALNVGSGTTIKPAVTWKRALWRHPAQVADTS
jgi:hypothetical protein